jgi:hypothetical protein
MECDIIVVHQPVELQWNLSFSMYKEEPRGSGSGLLTCAQEVPGSNPTVSVRFWLGLFASLPHLTQVLNGYLVGGECICVCEANSADLKVQLGCSLSSELSRYFERTGQWANVVCEAPRTSYLSLDIA